MKLNKHPISIFILMALLLLTITCKSEEQRLQNQELVMKVMERADDIQKQLEATQPDEEEYIQRTTIEGEETIEETMADDKAMDYLTEDITAVIHTEYGDIELAFYKNAAPETMANFIKLAEEGFYDGIRFHRVIPNFMIQGGDPNTKDDDRSNDGFGGPGYTIPLEIVPELSHERGAVAMAKPGGADYSSGSQFYICVEPSPFLDGDYTIFAKVIKGMDVADQIVSLPRDERDNPLPGHDTTMTIEINQD